MNVMSWGGGDGPIRRTLLLRAAEVAQFTDEEAASVTTALIETLQTSVEANVPGLTETAGADALIADWLDAIAALSDIDATAMEQRLGEIETSTPFAGVTALRLRVALRRRFGGRAFAANVLKPFAAETAASQLAGEWLELMPRASTVASVHHDIAIGTGPLARYAKVTTKARTELWVALEADDASAEHLGAVGAPGLDGSAIRHMAPKILEPSQFEQRESAVNRLLTANFAEAATGKTTVQGEAGHKEATALAATLVQQKSAGDKVLAARIVIHSGGVAHMQDHTSQNRVLRVCKWDAIQQAAAGASRGSGRTGI